eukprot:145931-Amphidinium_carterae.1
MEAIKKQLAPLKKQLGNKAAGAQQPNKGGGKGTVHKLTLAAGLTPRSMTTSSSGWVCVLPPPHHSANCFTSASLRQPGWELEVRSATRRSHGRCRSKRSERHPGASVVQRSSATPKDA